MLAADVTIKPAVLQEKGAFCQSEATREIAMALPNLRRNLLGSQTCGIIPRMARGKELASITGATTVTQTEISPSSPNANSHQPTEHGGSRARNITILGCAGLMLASYVGMGIDAGISEWQGEKAARKIMGEQKISIPTEEQSRDAVDIPFPRPNAPVKIVSDVDKQKALVVFQMRLTTTLIGVVETSPR